MIVIRVLVEDILVLVSNLTNHSTGKYYHVGRPLVACAVEDSLGQYSLSYSSTCIGIDLYLGKSNMYVTRYLGRYGKAGAKAMVTCYSSHDLDVENAKGAMGYTWGSETVSKCEIQHNKGRAEMGPSDRHCCILVSRTPYYRLDWAVLAPCSVNRTMAG